MVDTDQAVVYTRHMVILLLFIVLFPGVAVTLGIPLALYLWAAHRWPNACDFINKPKPLKEQWTAEQIVVNIVAVVFGIIFFTWIRQFAH